ncbi:Uncharacterised protein [Serratia rubidaea]|uniref:Uncharacterized protein n=1 Tax=Serratia rubidaea TaxID=61652 RepID=A0A3S4FTS3_SERRU|nr:Uncharacterised protein [Serratia rubidaea]
MVAQPADAGGGTRAALAADAAAAYAEGPLALILLVTLLLGYSLPVLGASIVLFLLADVLRYAWLRRRQAD